MWPAKISPFTLSPPSLPCYKFISLSPSSPSSLAIGFIAPLVSSLAAATGFYRSWSLLISSLKSAPGLLPRRRNSGSSLSQFQFSVIFSNLSFIQVSLWLVLQQKDSADLIRGDAKERLKVNEMLMELLLRLDSIRGVDLGVRDCRKRVIKKVIMLQERVDAIASRDAEDVAEESQDQIEPEDQMAAERSTAEESQNYVAQVDEENVENQKQLECSTGEENTNAVGELEEEVTDAGESVQDQYSEVEEGYLLVKGEAEKDAMECVAAVGNVDENRNNKGLMETMIERNEILIGLVTDLCEKNKMQTQSSGLVSKTKRITIAHSNAMVKVFYFKKPKPDNGGIIKFHMYTNSIKGIEWNVEEQWAAQSACQYRVLPAVGTYTKMPESVASSIAV